eukprot:scpid30615/ scgid34388/ Sodium/potassium/calcium exchanger 6; Na(+)/K(+)/Ca(2+)-exchange protein 6; Solute carrier family 24 member 6
MKPLAISYSAVCVAVLGMYCCCCRAVTGTTDMNQAMLVRMDENTTNNNSSKIYCKDVHVHNTSNQCRFVETTDDCAIAGGFISYLELPYCHLNSNLQPLAMVVLFLWLLYLFLAIGVTVEYFLCPALSVISNTLGLSESVAGVTFLAFGNGAADIFSLFVLITTGDQDPVRAETGMGAILGGGLFVTSVVVGLIAFNYPLHIKLTTFLRDVGFYVAAICWLIVMLWDGRIMRYEALGYIMLYVVYVSTVIIMLKWSQRGTAHLADAGAGASERTPLLGSPDHGSASRQQSGGGGSSHGTTGTSGGKDLGASLGGGSMSESYTGGAFTGNIAGGSVDWRMASDGSLLKSNQDDDLPASDSTPASTGQSSAVGSPGKQSDDNTAHKLEIGKAGAQNVPRSAWSASESTRQLEVAAHHAAPRSEASEPIAESSTTASPPPLPPPPVSPWRKLATGLWPYSVDDFKALSWLGRVMLVLRVPIRLCLTLTTPVIQPSNDDDTDEHTNANWNKFLIAANCLMAPIFATLALDLFFHKIQGAEVIFVGVVASGVGLLLFFCVIVFTRSYQAPRAKPIFSFLGFLMSVAWIYMIANEVVNILDTVGVVLKLNGAFLGLTVLAGGNSVCDLVANFLVAKSGKAEMAVAACYGSPLLNMLIGVGLSATVATFRDGEHYQLEYTNQLIVASSALLAGLAFATTYVVLSHCKCGWKAGRAFGIPLFCGYGAFLTAVLALEFA